MARLSIAVALVLALAAACGGSDDATEDGSPSVEGFELTSGDVTAREAIGIDYTCDGDDLSPALSWIGAPEGTRELALVMDDPDADGFTHWLAYGMPSSVTALPAGVPAAPQVSDPTPLLQGTNSFGRVGYGGPCPPEGETHTYVFRLLALEVELSLPPGANRTAFDAAIEGHVIAEATLEAPYTRAG
jgi:Raf kinase inhibitor-like YbhB/YbcL family protein